jgi:hypothetical protein
MSYVPQTGTIAHRAIEHLKALPEGQEIATAVLGEAIGLDDSSSLTTFLVPAVLAGLVRKTRRHGSRMLWWSLGDGTPPEDHEQDTPLARHPEPAGPVPKGQLFPGVEGFAAELPKPGQVTCAPAEQPTRQAEPDLEPEPAEFDYCLFRDGTLQLWGVVVNDDGSVSITADQLHEIRGRVAWLPAPSHREGPP